MVNNVEGLPIPEIYINSDMILSFEEETCDWNEEGPNTLVTNPSKSMSTNIHSTSNKLNVNVNVNVNRNVSYNHSSSSSANNTNSSNIEELNASVEGNQTKTNEITKKVVENRKILDSSENSEKETSRFTKVLNNEPPNRDENHHFKTGSNLRLENSNILQFGSFVDTDCVDLDLKEKESSLKSDSKTIKRRRGDPKLCWRCHKRDATPHMRSCEPCRVADRQRWSRRRNLSKFISDNNNLITQLDLNGTYSTYLKEARVGLNVDSPKSEIFRNNYLQNNIQLKHDTNQCILGTPESIRSINTSITHSGGSSSLSGISLKYPLIKEQWHDQQFQMYRDNRTSQSYNDIVQNLSYITITYYPSSFSGLTTLPVSAKFASDGSINGLETLPSVVLSFIVDKCNEQLLQRQIIRQNTQHIGHSGNLISSQLESGVGNVLTNNAEIHKGVMNGGACNSFHNIHCSNFHCNSLDPRLYC